MSQTSFTRFKDQLSIIPPTIWALGFVTFFINVSSTMVFGFSALYLSAILGVGVSGIGFLEGLVEGMSYLLKLFSGVVSDYMKKRKRLVVLGCSLVALSRPLLALSGSFATVFGARLLDRIGNGIQSTPRDALVSDWAPAKHKGASFGLRQALATAGSFSGGFIGYWAMKATGGNYHAVFWLSVIPAFIGILILIIFVKEPKKAPEGTIKLDNSYEDIKEEKKKKYFSWNDLKKLGSSYWWLMGVAGTFMLARLGEAFLILYAHKEFDLLQEQGPYILILYNAAYSICSYPVGKLSDKVSRYTILGLGISVLIITDLLLWSAPSLDMVYFGVVLWGVQMAITQSMFLSLIADMVPKGLRGTGFGFFYFISAISVMIACSGGGYFAKNYGLSSAYLASAIVAGVSLLSLFYVVVRVRRFK